MTRSRWLPLGFFLFLAFMAAVIGAVATATGVNGWYAALAKPEWTPPNWAFAPAWTVLYVLMSVAAWRVWLKDSPTNARHVFRLFAAQLALNALWSILFFGLHRPGAALIDVLLLWFVLLRLLILFKAVDRLAAWLWAPYLAWVTFAATLNAAVWDLNR